MARSAPAPSLRPYEPPQIFRIRIAGDELAVAGCKSAVNGPGGGVPSCAKSICKSTGS